MSQNHMLETVGPRAALIGLGNVNVIKIQRVLGELLCRDRVNGTTRRIFVTTHTIE